MKKFTRRVLKALCLADAMAKVINVYRAYAWMQDRFDK